MMVSAFGFVFTISCICYLNSFADALIDQSSLQGWQALYDATNGTRWTYCSQLRDRPCSCDEPDNSPRPNKLVTCNYINGEFRIKQIVLRSNNLVGTIPVAALQNMKYLNYIDLSYHEGFGDLRGPEEYVTAGYDRGCIDWVTCSYKFQLCTFDPVVICPDYREDSTYRPTTNTLAPTQAPTPLNIPGGVNGVIIFFVVLIVLIIVFIAYRCYRRKKKNTQYQAARTDGQGDDTYDQEAITSKSGIAMLKSNTTMSKPYSDVEGIDGTSANEEDVDSSNFRLGVAKSMKNTRPTEQENVELSAIQDLINAEKANDKEAVAKAQKAILGEKNDDDKELVIQ